MVRRMLLDTSYMVYYRYHALSAWFKMSKQPEPPNHDDILSDELFMEKFTRLFIDCVKKLCKKHKVLPENVLMAIDGPSRDMWRLAIYPEYKDGRAGTKDKFDGHIFVHVKEVLLPLLEEKYGIRSVSVPTAEADDIIAVASRIVTAVGDEVVIVSSDCDMIQLHGDCCTQWNLKGVQVTGSGDPARDLQRKVLCGDRSDNIPAVSKLSAEALETCLDDGAALEAFLEREGATAREQYERNRRLIDMNLIPDSLCEQITNRLKQIGW